VVRLNGFTKARNPGVLNASPVRFETVSGSNPLAIVVGATSVNVIGYTPATPGDEIGPGTLLLDAPITCGLRDPVMASDKTYLHRVGGGNSVDSIGNTDLLTLADIRVQVAHFRQMNVPEQADGRFHVHLDPLSEAQIYQDHEWQRLLTALPDYYMYRQFAIGELLGCVYFRNSECPLPETVDGGMTAIYTQDDPFAGELYAGGVTSGVRIHRALFAGQGGIFEYYQDLSQLITEAGVTGRVGEPKITNNSIEVPCERTQIIIRAPLDVHQDQVASAWKFIGDWPTRTDACTGDGARYKRLGCVEHGEAP